MASPPRLMPSLLGQAWTATFCLCYILHSGGNWTCWHSILNGGGEITCINRHDLSCLKVTDPNPITMYALPWNQHHHFISPDWHVLSTFFEANWFPVGITHATWGRCMSAEGWDFCMSGVCVCPHRFRFTFIEAFNMCSKCWANPGKPHKVQEWGPWVNFKGEESFINMNLFCFVLLAKRLMSTISLRRIVYSLYTYRNLTQKCPWRAVRKSRLQGCRLTSISYSTFMKFAPVLWELHHIGTASVGGNTRL